MEFLSALHTDIGTKKETNQDSMLLMQAETSMGEVLFAAICDGMGGLAKGELASAELTLALADWFRQDFPALLEKGFQPSALREQWSEIVERQNRRISRYSSENGLRMGTTLVGLLCLGERYFIINVGDSRLYLVEDQLYQLTHDHTLVQREVDLGRLTPEQALTDSRRSMLLQCIGAGEQVKPDFFVGTLEENQLFLLCCDGFRHVMSAEEFCDYLYGDGEERTEEELKETLMEMTEEIKRRGETDNISAIVIRTGKKQKGL